MLRAIARRHAAIVPTSCDLSAVAAQLVEAAWYAREGDSEAAKAHIARAITLLDGYPGLRTPAVGTDGTEVARIRRGAFAAWQARRLAAHVEANLGAKIYIKDLAAFLGVSSSHFCSAFKRTFGMPAHIWVARRRIEAAQGLMLTTSASLSEISLRCGMSDQSHFTRAFRRIVGETPHAWRQSRRGSMEEEHAMLFNAGAQDPSSRRHR
jgi:AraC family transcriptional regulator